MTQNQPSQVPPYPGAQPPPAASKPPRSVLGMVALGVAAAGFLFAVIEGAYLLGWVLLPIGFILGLVALFQKGPKKLAIAAVIVSVVGTVAGVAAFTSSMARITDEAFGGTKPSVVPSAPAATADGSAQTPPVADASAQPERAPDPAPNPAAELGTRENPYPLGTTVSTDDWEVIVNSWTPGADQQVKAANMFNDEPGEGQEYGLVNLTVTRVGEESASPMFEVRVDYVSASGNVFDDFAVAPDALSDNELFTGASATGNEALMVPIDDDGRIRVKIGFIGSKDVFFALS